MSTQTHWHYTTQGNGLTVTIHAPDGRSVFLQGDDAAQFLEQAADIERCDDARITIADLCQEYFMD